MRVQETVINGADGSIIEELGYESYDKTIAIGLRVGADVDTTCESLIEEWCRIGDALAIIAEQEFAL